MTTDEARKVALELSAAISADIWNHDGVGPESELRWSDLIAAALLAAAAQPNAEVERLREEVHYANGVADLAMKHRNDAEAEAVRAMNACTHAEAELKEAEAEIAALRTALELGLEIADGKCPPLKAAHDEFRRMARTALERKP